MLWTGRQEWSRFQGEIGMAGMISERPGFRLSKFFGKRGFLTAIFLPALRGPWFLSAERGPFGRYYYFSGKKSDTLGAISRGSFAFHNDISPFYFISFHS